MIATIQAVGPARDHDLQRRVENFLATRYRPALKKLEVEARAGAITLRGNVSSFYEKQIAIGCCRRVAGTLRVIDLVQVSPAQQRADSL